MKYTTKIKQAQLVGKVKIDPNGGDLPEAEAKAVRADPWGKALIERGLLTIEGSSQSLTQAAHADNTPKQGGNNSGK